jgi:hypothetical protein
MRGPTAAAGALSGAAYATLLLIALMMGANHVAARVAFDHGVDVVTAVAFRSAVTVLVVGTMLWHSRVPLRVSVRQRKALPAIGVLIAVQKPVPVLGGGAAAGGAGTACVQHLPAVDRAVGALGLQAPAGAPRAPGDAGDADRARPRPRRPRCRLGLGCSGTVAADRRRRRFCAGRRGDVRPGTDTHPARGRRARRATAHRFDAGDGWWRCSPASAR